jgi:hypothetical protein
MAGVSQPDVARASRSSFKLAQRQAELPAACRSVRARSCPSACWMNRNGPGRDRGVHAPATPLTDPPGLVVVARAAYASGDVARA